MWNEAPATNISNVWTIAATRMKARVAHRVAPDHGDSARSRARRRDSDGCSLPGNAKGVRYRIWR